MSWRPKQLVDGGANVITTVEPADAHISTQKEQLSHASGPLITLDVRKPDRALAFTLSQKERLSYATGLRLFTLPVQGPFYVDEFTLPQKLLGSRYYFPRRVVPLEFSIDIQATKNKWAVSTDMPVKWTISAQSKYKPVVIL